MGTPEQEKKGPPGGAPPKRAVPAIATLLVRSDKPTGKANPLLPGLVVLFRTATMSPIPEKAKAKPAGKGKDEPAPAPPPPAPPSFSAGMVDRRGYLVPWEKIREQRTQRKAITTDSIKFVGPPSDDATYDFFLVSHPDPARIQAILDNVNANGGVFKAADGAETKPLALKLGKGAGKGNEHVLEVPEDPAKILPVEGGKDYDGWLLYRDMPHQGCAAVAKQIEKLQKALGAMRYPLGSGDDPYTPEDNNRGAFDVRTWNCVLAFQRAFLGRPKAEGDDGGEQGPQPFVKTDSVKKLVDAADGVAFANIALSEKMGDPVSPGGSAPKPARADGVVDDPTARALKHCIDEELRKPGHVLHPFLHEMDATSVRWMRAEAASAVGTWRELAKTFGWTQGIHAFHTYRSCLADITSADYGRATLSIHKSGYALDLQMSGYIVPWAAPDLFYEKVPRGGRVRWRLWCRIKADKGKLGAGFDAVAEILADRHAKVRDQIGKAAEQWDAADKEKKAKGKRPAVPGALAAADIAKLYRACLDEEVVGGPGFREAAKKVSEALALDRGDVYDKFLEEDVEHLLDDEVDAFEYHRDHPKFASDDKDFFVTKTAGKGEVFLCLTALARLARLTGISAFADGWHSTRKNATLPAKVTLPLGSSEPFSCVVSWIAMAHKRFDADLVADRGAALIDHIVSGVLAVQDSKLGTRSKGTFTPNANVSGLVADLPSSAFGRHLRPLFGSELDTAPSAKDLRDKLVAQLSAFAEQAVARRAEVLGKDPKARRAEVTDEIRKLAPPHRAAVDAAISEFESGRPIDSGKLWHVRISRDGQTTEVPLKDITEASVAALGAWKAGCAKRKISATPTIVLTDVKAKVDAKDRTVTVDPGQPRLKALTELLKELKDVTLEVRAAFFVPGAPPKDAKKKSDTTPVAGHVVSEIDLEPTGDVAEVVKKVLEEAYKDDDAVIHVPAILVSPRFPVLDIREGDSVEVTYPGEPIGMEWWHHQYHPALQGEEESSDGSGGAAKPKKWSTLLTEIGWELDVLGAGPGAIAYDYLGVGYSAKDLQKLAS